MSTGQYQNYLDYLIGSKFTIWKSLNNLILWLTLIILFYFNVSPLFSTVSITNLFFYLETYTFIPILFDIMLFFYILELFHLLFSKNRLEKVSAKYFTYNSLYGITIILTIYSLIIAFFIPEYNLFVFFNGPRWEQIYGLLILINVFAFLLILTFFKMKKSFTLIIVFLNIGFYVVSILSLSAVLGTTDQYFSTYMIPIIIMLSFQIKIYDFSRGVMNNQEFYDFITKHIVPLRLALKAKLFDTEAEYNDAMVKGAKNKNQLYLVNKYKADSYQHTVETMDHNFPDYPTYQDAKAHNILFYREWKKYVNNFERKVEVLTTDYTIQKKNLASLLKKSNRILLDQILQFIGSKDVKPILYWFAKLPDTFPMRLDRDMIVITSDITEEQIQYIVDSLFATLD